MVDPLFINARADQCSAPVLAHEQRIVHHGGEPYVMVGLYFGRGHNGVRELFYILRLLDGAAPGSQPR